MEDVWSWAVDCNVSSCIVKNNLDSTLPVRFLWTARLLHILQKRFSSRYTWEDRTTVRCVENAVRDQRWEKS